MTAPAPDDPRPVNFAFVSCQDVNEGKLNAYRRMIFEDERARARDQLDFVLHLGDFIYEVVEYPDEVKTRYDRTIYEVARIPDGGKVGKFHFPLTVDGYRAVYKGYLADPDLQDARARWPFVAHLGQPRILVAGLAEHRHRPAVRRSPGRRVKVAANQAWFEYHPGARDGAERHRSRASAPPAVQERRRSRSGTRTGWASSRTTSTAINSLIAYRALRYGRHLDLIITDQHSYRGADPFSDDSLGKIGDWAEYDGMFPEEAMQILDGGRAFNGGNPPAEIHFQDASIPNPRKDAPPQTILGAEQKAWFKDQLRSSTATWKIWGNSLGALD